MRLSGHQYELGFRGWRVCVFELESGICPVPDIQYRRPGAQGPSLRLQRWHWRFIWLITRYCSEWSQEWIVAGSTLLTGLKNSSHDHPEKVQQKNSCAKHGKKCFAQLEVESSHSLWSQAADASEPLAGSWRMKKGTKTCRNAESSEASCRRSVINVHLFTLCNCDLSQTLTYHRCLAQIWLKKRTENNLEVWIVNECNPG